MSRHSFKVCGVNPFQENLMKLTALIICVLSLFACNQQGAKRMNTSAPVEVLKKVYFKNALNLIPGLDNALFPKD